VKRTIHTHWQSSARKVLHDKITYHIPRVALHRIGMEKHPKGGVVVLELPSDDSVAEASRGEREGLLGDGLSRAGGWGPQGG
jgi:hypothetical protein